MLCPRVRPTTVAGCATFLIFSVLAVGEARAQAPAAPAPPRWQGNAVVSVSIQAGVTDQRAVSLSGEAFRSSPTWSYSLQADHTHASVKLGPEFQTVADAQTARFTAERGLTDVLYFVVRPAYKRNEVQAVDYRFEGLLGLGVRVVQTARAQINVLGAAGFVSQDKNVPSVDGTAGVGGVVQNAQFALNQQWRLTELALFLTPFNDSDDYRMQFQTALVGTIAGPLALNVSYAMDRENIVLGSSEKTDRRLTVGVQVNF